MLGKKKNFIVFVVSLISFYAFSESKKEVMKKETEIITKKDSLVIDNILPYDYKVEGNQIKIEAKGSSKVYYLKNLKQYPSIRITLPYHKVIEKKPGKEEGVRKEKKEDPKKKEFSKDDKQKIDMLIEKAKSSYLAGEFSKALQYLNQAKDLDENSPLIHKMIGSVYMQIGEENKGLEFYKSSLDLDPEQPDLQIEIKRMKEK